MSDAHHQASNAPHEGPIKTPKQLVWTVFASFVIPIIAIILLTRFVSFADKNGPGTPAMDPQAVAERIQPVGAVVLKAAGGGAARTGEQVFQAQCSACHAAGAMGAPKFGDAGAWAPRVKNGYDALLTSALKGKGSMSPQGGGEFSDYEIGRAVVYMANQGGAKFEEPKAPAAAASAAQ